MLCFDFSDLEKIAIIIVHHWKQLYQNYIQRYVKYNIYFYQVNQYYIESVKMNGKLNMEIKTSGSLYLM